jgi:NIMA (never in mitosis gene a)-related kinase
MSMQDFEIIKPLGKGAFASVFLVRRKEDNNIYALKRVTIDKLKKKEQDNSVNEVRILASINHINVIGYKEAFYEESSKTLNIVMEYADDGDLNSKINQVKQLKQHFSESKIWIYAIQMLMGLKALHDKKIMHRDLKSANVFLMKNGICKLGDLNVSKVAKMGVLRTQTGTPYYASPEVWKDGPYNYKSDLWSIGCVVYELCMLRQPFKGSNMDELYKNVLRGKYKEIDGKIYSKDLSDLIAMLLRVDPKKRPGCKEVLESDVVKRNLKWVEGLGSEIAKDSLKESDLLLNTIKFRDIKEIKSKLPKTNYDNEIDNEDSLTIFNQKQEHYEHNIEYNNDINTNGKNGNINDMSKKNPHNNKNNKRPLTAKNQQRNVNNNMKVIQAKGMKPIKKEATPIEKVNKNQNEKPRKRPLTSKNNRNKNININNNNNNINKKPVKEVNKKDKHILPLEIQSAKKASVSSNKKNIKIVNDKQIAQNSKPKANSSGISKRPLSSKPTQKNNQRVNKYESKNNNNINKVRPNSCSQRRNPQSNVLNKNNSKDLLINNKHNNPNIKPIVNNDPDRRMLMNPIQIKKKMSGNNSNGNIYNNNNLFLQGKAVNPHVITPLNNKHLLLNNGNNIKN